MLGRLVGTKQSGDPDWSCTSYDARGRVTQQTHPAFGTSPARTVTNNYAVGGDPLTASLSDTAGTITAVADLLGRTVTYTDIYGTVTTPSYDLVTGRVTSVSTTVAGIAGAKTAAYGYDLDGKVTHEDVDGATVATPSYSSSTQLLQSVAYSNGGSLSSVSYDANTGASTGIIWSFTTGANLADQVVRSQSGRVVQDTLTDGLASTSTSTYSYDAGGAPGHCDDPRPHPQLRVRRLRRMRG